MATYTPAIIELGLNNGRPRRYTVSNTTGITKLKMLTLSSPRTAAEVAAASVASGYAFAGIAAIEKEASDGATSITAYTEGIFDIACSGAVTVGQYVKSCGAGQVMAAVYNDASSGAIIGRALETGADTNVIAISLGGFL